MSAGRAAMWMISFGIAAASVAVLVVDGVEGFPYDWVGIAIAGVLATISFVLGLAD
jgi:hypothetical protein